MWRSTQRLYLTCDIAKVSSVVFTFHGCAIKHTQANNPNLTRKDRELRDITSKALLHLGAILVVDVFFHFLYILTIPADMRLVKKLSDWSLG